MAKNEEKQGLMGKIATAFDLLGRAKQAIRDFAEHVEELVAEKVQRLKRGFTLYVIMLLFLMVGVLFVIAGGVVYLRNFLPLHAALIISGVVCLGVALYLTKK
ncbi:MAG: hypothetical protein Q7S65_01020 [Nanoarchaeota archaeon]|nr:hypothetical protein [Nanoarchaeota archaeon]